METSREEIGYKEGITMKFPKKAKGRLAGKKVGTSKMVKATKKGGTTASAKKPGKKKFKFNFG